MATCNRGDVRLALRRCFEYLDRHGTLAGRFCGSGVSADVVFGENDDVGLTAQEGAALKPCPTTRLRFIPGCGHMMLNQRPDLVAELIGDMANVASHV
jgi:pimeloyl-ACP methyl ester carboxylesterase